MHTVFMLGFDEPPPRRCKRHFELCKPPVPQGVNLKTPQVSMWRSRVLPHAAPSPLDALESRSPQYRACALLAPPSCTLCTPRVCGSVRAGEAHRSLTREDPPSTRHQVSMLPSRVKRAAVLRSKPMHCCKRLTTRLVRYRPRRIRALKQPHGAQPYRL